MNYDYNKRGYLLPEGCKDLIDVLRLNVQKMALELQPLWLPRQPKTLKPLPPIGGEIVVPARATVLELAKILNLKPFAIIADLMEAGVFANVNHVLEFEMMAKVACKHGYVAKLSNS